MSGGQRQRVMIAMAMACNPKILFADEPTTALDVTMQAQILDLMNSLKKEMGTSILLITHDLGVVAKMADRIAVMYAGKVVEYGDARQIFYNPCHPYTWGLLGADAESDPGSKERVVRHSWHSARSVCTAEGLCLCGQMSICHGSLPEGGSAGIYLLRRAHFPVLADG